MKKHLSVLFLFAATLISLSSQDFSRQLPGKIEIWTKSQIVGSAYKGSFSATTVSTWTAYLDGEKLREEDFFRITGDLKTSELAHSRRIWAISIFWPSLVLAFGGEIVWLSTMDELGGNNPIVIAGGVAMLSGLAGLLVTIPLASNTRELPYAVHLAERYNANH